MFACRSSVGTGALSITICSMAGLVYVDYHLGCNVVLVLDVYGPGSDYKFSSVGGLLLIYFGGD